jgi:hypothetical protein
MSSIRISKRVFDGMTNNEESQESESSEAKYINIWKGRSRGKAEAHVATILSLGCIILIM